MNPSSWSSLVVAYCLLSASWSFAQNESHHYGLKYDLALKPADDRAEVSLTVDKLAKGNITSMRFHIDPERHTEFAGDGKIDADGEYVTWTPPDAGGRFSFQVPVSHGRSNDRFDARMTDDWAIFRGDDIFPPARTEQLDDAEADATLHVHVPEGWSFLTAYPSSEKNVFEIEHAHRSFDRPTGWMAAGHLGVRRDLIAGTRVVVAGPLNEGVRRLDMMALLNWNLPRIRRLVPDMPERILVVSAGDPMWRGGLSGPNSLFLHADRPLLSENGSSTLVHELIHVANRLEAAERADWIIEGLAEYYALKVLWRSGTLTDHRYQQSFLKYEEWAKQADRLDAQASSGPVTAKAVGIMRKLDREIYNKTQQKKSLDDVMRLLVAIGEKVSCEGLREAVTDVMGEPAYALSDHALGFVEIKSDKPSTEESATPSDTPK